MRNWEKVKKDLLRDGATRREYEKLAPRYAVISQLIAARLKKGITQKELAQKVGTKQSAIARLEGGMTNHTLEFLDRIASVMGYKLTVQLH
ncbi:MAG: helix-turn-helix transcriptional regulator [Candidatus Levybacteria bacterium]|nr:helix-turn-helix transcriptional regulator [Candidatus Levybacteria bacterium]